MVTPEHDTYMLIQPTEPTIPQGNREEISLEVKISTYIGLLQAKSANQNGILNERSALLATMRQVPIVFGTILLTILGIVFPLNTTISTQFIQVLMNIIIVCCFVLVPAIMWESGQLSLVKDELQFDLSITMAQIEFILNQLGVDTPVLDELKERLKPHLRNSYLKTVRTAYITYASIIFFLGVLVALIFSAIKNLPLVFTVTVTGGGLLVGIVIVSVFSLHFKKSRPEYQGFPYPIRVLSGTGEMIKARSSLLPTDPECLVIINKEKWYKVPKRTVKFYAMYFATAYTPPIQLLNESYTVWQQIEQIQRDPEKTVLCARLCAKVYQPNEEHLFEPGSQEHIMNDAALQAVTLMLTVMGANEGYSIGLMSNRFMAYLEKLTHLPEKLSADMLIRDNFLLLVCALANSTWNENKDWQHKFKRHNNLGTAYQEEFIQQLPYAKLRLEKDIAQIRVAASWLLKQLQSL